MPTSLKISPVTTPPNEARNEIKYSDMIVSPEDIKVVIGDDEREEFLINRVKKIRSELKAIILPSKVKVN